jgi:hypothetical protein
VRALPFVILALLLAACGHSPDDDRLSHYDISAGGFSLSVPDTWHATTSSQTDPASFKRFLDENPALAPFTEARERGESPFTFFAWDPDAREEFLTNLTVSVTPVASNTTPEQYRRSAIAEAREIAISVVETSDVSLPAGTALRLSFEAKFDVDRRTKKVSTLQYAMLRDGQSYVLTCTTLPQFAARYRTIFEATVDSFRFTEI